MLNGRDEDRNFVEGFRCQVEETLTGGRCGLPVEVHSPDGLFLCGRHAEEVESLERVTLLRGIVSTLDLCLVSLSVRRDAELLRALQSRRAEAAEELAHALQNPSITGSSP
ncbi:MAG: hypothetical protein ACR2GU_04675 [Rubrobacteraceae bacterium]